MPSSEQIVSEIDICSHLMLPRGSLRAGAVFAAKNHQAVSPLRTVLKV
jgi:hypothetical protein